MYIYCSVTADVHALATYVPFITSNYCPFTYTSLYKFVTVLITGVYFLEVKINHDTHEFILDYGTVTDKRTPAILYRGWLEGF